MALINQKNTKKGKKAIFFILSVFMLTQLVSLVTKPMTASAEEPMYKKFTADQLADSLVYFNYLRTCIDGDDLRSDGGTSISIEDAKAGRWFREVTGFYSGGQALFPIGAYLGVIEDTESTYMGYKCGGANAIKTINAAADLWGYNSQAKPGEGLINMLCDAGATIWGKTGSYKPGERIIDCNTNVTGDTPFAGMDKSGKNNRLDVIEFAKNIEKRVYEYGYTATNTPEFLANDYVGNDKNILYYLLQRQVFTTQCLTDYSPGSIYNGSAAANLVYDYNVVDDTTGMLTNNKYLGIDKSLPVATFTYGADANKGDIIWPSSTYASNMGCGNLLEYVNSGATLWSKFLLSLAADSPLKPAGQVAQNTTNSATPTSCAIKSIGWMVCPVVQFLSETADSIYGYIAKEFLVIPVGENGILNQQVKDVWKNFVGLANVAFIIAFLIIIISQLTSVGIDNYGIKKMLPKLVIAVILVNVSFYVCQVAVDISNVVGGSVNSFVSGFAPPSASVQNGSLLASLPESWKDQGASGLSGVSKVVLGITGVALLAALGTLIPVAIGAVIGAVMILLLLAARKALIIVLVILAPLAFVAYLLPNTEKLFTTWKKTFMAMLMLYPVTAFVFAASKLASEILSTAANNKTGLDNVSAISQILAAAVAVLPLFIVPSMLKKSLDAVAGLGNIANKLTAGAQGLGKSVPKSITDKYNNSEFGKYRASQKNDRKARIRAGNYYGKGGMLNPRNIRSTMYQGLNSNKLFNAASGGFGANKDFAMNKQSKEDKESFTKMVGDNEDLYTAIANGGFDEDSTAFKGLTHENQLQIQKMKSLDLDRKASTYLATAEYMGTNGLGDGFEAATAIRTATKFGADQDDVLQSFETVKSGYKKAGQAKALTRVHNAGEGYHKTINPKYEMQETTLAKAFGKITPKDLSKFTFSDPDSETDPAKKAILNAALADELKSYDAMLKDRNSLNTTLNQFPDMNIGTQKIINQTVLDRANAEAIDQAHARGLNPPAPFTTVQDAKNYFQANK